MSFFKKTGFTLAELLVCITILGVISAYTIPKVLSAQAGQQYNAVAKEAGAAIAQAYSTYKMNNPVSASTSFLDLIPYLNYVKADSTSYLDQNPSVGSFIACSNANYYCYRLASGATIFINLPNATFGGTASNRAMSFVVDPNGRYDGTYSVNFWLYINGRLSTLKNIDTNTCSSYVCLSATANGDPTWFSW